MTAITRRTLLAAASTVGVRALAGANDHIRFGLIGCGNAGQMAAPAFLSDPGVHCAAVCDVDSSRCSQMATVVERLRGERPAEWSDFRRILDRKDIDALVVCTPDHWHALMTV